ncbi:MAG: hypothetical protein JWP00_4836 [Chloroflexi bacterium]|nr:hypothetical protein [Chloroflexota bacterium]
MFLSCKLKLSKKLVSFIVAIMVTVMVAGCTEQVPTATVTTSKPAQLTPNAFKSSVSQTPGTSNSNVANIPALSPTLAPVFLPTATPETATVNDIDKAGPTTTPGLTPAEQQDQALAGNIPSTVSGLDVSKLPRVNGLPKIPLTNLIPATQAAVPDRKANYGAKGQPKVGIQAGHWLIDQLPDQLASLRAQTGGSGGGVREVDLTLDLARRVTQLLQDKGYEVDLLPATVPVNYTADAFVAIHADASTSGAPNGYKLARSRFSPIPVTDDAFVKAVSDSYGAATGLALDNNITRNMSGYYAFNSRRRVNAVSKGTPALIIETGYLTNAGDRAFLLSKKDIIARSIAQGVINFLSNRPVLELREKPSQTTPALVVSQDNIPVYDQADGTPIAYLSKDQRFEVYEVRGDHYVVFLPYLNKTGFLRRADAATVTLPR